MKMILYFNFVILYLFVGLVFSYQVYEVSSLYSYDEGDSFGYMQVGAGYQYPSITFVPQQNITQSNIVINSTTVYSKLSTFPSGAKNFTFTTTIKYNNGTIAGIITKNVNRLFRPTFSPVIWGTPIVKNQYFPNTPYKSILLAIPFSSSSSEYPGITISDPVFGVNDDYSSIFAYSTNNNNQSLVILTWARNFGYFDSNFLLFININGVGSATGVSYSTFGSRYSIKDLVYFPSKFSNNLYKAYAMVTTINNTAGCDIEFVNPSFPFTNTFPVYGDVKGNATYLYWTDLKGYSFLGNLLISLTLYTYIPNSIELGSISFQYFINRTNSNMKYINYLSKDLTSEGIGYLLLPQLEGDKTKGPSNKIFQNLKTPEKPFPYGFIYFQSKQQRYMEIFTSKHGPGYFNLEFNGNLCYQNTLYIISQPDTTPPELLNYWFTLNPNNSNEITLHTEISDDLSGFFSLLFSDIIYNLMFDSNSLVNGSLLNGYYQFTYLFDKFSFGMVSSSIQIYDVSGNYNVYEIPNFDILLLDGNYIDIIGHNFTSFYYSNNNVNLNGQEVSNSLFFSLLYPNKNYPVVFKPCFSPTIPVLSFYGFFNETSGLYKVDFTIPKSLVGNKEISFTITIGRHVFLNIEINTLHPTSVLTVYNQVQFADEMPPMVTSIIPYPSPSVTLNSILSFPYTVGLKITISDPINGFKNGTIKISSDNDILGYTFNITPNNTVSGDQFTGTYELYFDITSPNWLSHRYYINDIELWDNDNHVATNHSSFILHIIDPLMMFYDYMPFLEIISDKNISTQYIPVLSDMKLSKPWVDMNSPFRLLTVYFNISINEPDLLSIKDKPIIYFNTVNNVYFETCVSTLTSKINSTFYQYECTHEFSKGFGTGFNVTISIFNIASTLGLYNGMTTYQLSNEGYPYFINTNILSKPGDVPFIYFIPPFYSNDTKITLYGLNFYTNFNTSTILIDYSNDTQEYFSGIKNIILEQPDTLIVELINPSYYSFNIKIVINELISNIYEVIPIQIATPPPTSTSTTTPTSTSTSTSTPKFCTPNDDCSNNGLTKSQIVGISIGGFIFVLTSCILTFILYRKLRSKSISQDNTSVVDDTGFEMISAEMKSL